MNVGQFALIRSTRPLSIGMAAGARPLRVGERGQCGLAGFEMAQHVMQAFFDPAEIAGTMVRRRFEPSRPIRHALFESGKRDQSLPTCKWSETVHSARRAPEIWSECRYQRQFAAFSDRCQRRAALSSTANECRASDRANWSTWP